MDLGSHSVGLHSSTSQ